MMYDCSIYRQSEIAAKKLGRARLYAIDIEEREAHTFGVRLHLAAIWLLVSFAFPSASRGQDVPVFEIKPIDSSVKFLVKASVALEGNFDKWDATLKYT
jgi:hypothetical protein